MIISASRRTDLPSYYMDWFLERLREGYVMVRNPFRPRQVSQVNLSKQDVDCIVFWSKNPKHLFDRLSELEGYPFYIQFTLNPYGSVLEPGLPPLAERIQTFLDLSRRLGRRRMVWRYDPILLNETYPKEYHIEQFQSLCSQLAQGADECIISFMDEYQNTRRNEKALGSDPAPSADEMKQLVSALVQYAASYGLPVRACAEEVDFSSCGVPPAHCIDAARIREISGRDVSGRKDASQRKACGCIKSVDIGMYNTCLNGCLYCYANYNPAVIRRHYSRHNPNSPFLSGDREPNDTITVRK